MVIVARESVESHDRRVRRRKDGILEGRPINNTAVDVLFALLAKTEREKDRLWLRNAV